MAKNKSAKARKDPPVKEAHVKHGGQKAKTKGKKDTATPPPSLPSTTSGIRDDPVLGYKLRVLIHDVCNIAKDASSLARINTTTDEHYISEPYFSPEQVACIKSAVVDVSISKFLNPADADENAWDENENNQDDVTNNASPDIATSALQGKPMDQAIRTLLDNFFEKRRASGDARPCGPHDLAPVYAALFGIQLAELKEDKFLQRYRRTRLGDAWVVASQHNYRRTCLESSTCIPALPLAAVVAYTPERSCCPCARLTDLYTWELSRQPSAVLSRQRF